MTCDVLSEEKIPSTTSSCFKMKTIPVASHKKAHSLLQSSSPRPTANGFNAIKNRGSIFTHEENRISDNDKIPKRSVHFSETSQITHKQEPNKSHKHNLKKIKRKKEMKNGNPAEDVHPTDLFDTINDEDSQTLGSKHSEMDGSTTTTTSIWSLPHYNPLQSSILMRGKNMYRAPASYMKQYTFPQFRKEPHTNHNEYSSLAKRKILHIREKGAFFQKTTSNSSNDSEVMNDLVKAMKAEYGSYLLKTDPTVFTDLEVEKELDFIGGPYPEASTKYLPNHKNKTLHVGTTLIARNTNLLKKGVTISSTSKSTEQNICSNKPIRLGNWQEEHSRVALNLHHSQQKPITCMSCKVTLSPKKAINDEKFHKDETTIRDSTNSNEQKYLFEEKNVNISSHKVTQSQPPYSYGTYGQRGNLDPSRNSWTRVHPKLPPSMIPDKLALYYGDKLKEKQNQNKNRICSKFDNCKPHDSIANPIKIKSTDQDNRTTVQWKNIGMGLSASDPFHAEVNYENIRHTSDSNKNTAVQVDHQNAIHTANIQNMKHEHINTTASASMYKIEENVQLEKESYGHERLGSDVDSEEAFVSSMSIASKTQLITDTCLTEWENDRVKFSESLASGDSQLSPIPIPNKKHLTSIRRGPAMYSYPNAFSPEKLSLTDVKRGKMQLLKERKASWKDPRKSKNK